MDWFRWWHGTLTDPKFRWVARKSGCSFTAVIAIWVALLERASCVTDGDEYVTRGDVTGFDCDAHDAMLDVDDGTCARILAAFLDKGMVAGGRIVNWEKRQPKREDSSAERTRAYRERIKAAKSCDAPVTRGDADVTQRDADEHDVTPRLDKKRLKEPPIPPKGGDIELSKKRPAIAFKAFLEQCRRAGERPIPENDSVFDYADKTGIPMDYLRLHWLEFKERYSVPDAKRYKDWRTVYRKSVRGNWFRLWFIRADGDCRLTTQGEQARRQHQEAA